MAHGAVRGFDPSVHAVAPTDPGYSPLLSPSQNNRLADRWRQAGFDERSWASWAHLMLSPTACAALRDAGARPMARDTREQATALRRALSADAVASGIGPVDADALGSMAAMSVLGGLDGRTLMDECVEHLLDDDTLEVDVAWAGAVLAVEAARMTLDVVVVGDTRRYVADVAAGARSSVLAGVLRDQWGIKEISGDSTVIDAVEAWESFGATPQRAAKWTMWGVFHPEDAFGFHRAGVRPEDALEIGQDLSKRTCAALHEEASRKALRDRVSFDDIELLRIHDVEAVRFTVECAEALLDEQVPCPRLLTWNAFPFVRHVLRPAQ